jgi:hypothetical protein
MANPLLEFDPTSEDAANSPLEIWNTTSYAVSAFNAPAPPLTVQWAGSVDTEGSLPSSKKHENRTISITVDVLSAAALRSLQAKIGKVTREGGTLKLTLPASSEVVVFDLHSADTFEPQLDIVYFVNSGAFCTVNLSLTAKPYGRGPQETLTLSAATAPSKAPLVVTATTGVKGDMAALGTLSLQNDPFGHTMTFGLWGIQSRYYDASANAALFLEAENGVAGAAALNAGAAGASGGGANKVMRHLDVGTVGATASYVMGVSGATTMQHVGTFRVFARVQALSTNTGTVSVRLDWNMRLGNVTSNDWVPIATAVGAAIKGSWVLVDLGLVSLPKARKGDQRWDGLVYAKSTVATDDIDFDWVTLFPVDEGFGRVEAGSIATSETVEFAYDAVQIVTSGTIWHDPTLYEGDLVTIPPAGAEGRTLRVVALLAGQSAGNLTDTVIDAVNLDQFTPTLTYVPRYLVVPSP